MSTEHNGHIDSSAGQAGLWTGSSWPTITAADRAEREEAQGKKSRYTTLTGLKCTCIVVNSKELFSDVQMKFLKITNL